MTVAELIVFLQKQPQDLQVAYCLYSEQVLLNVNQVGIQTLGAPRPDGWVPNARPGQPTQDYLLFPGN